MRVLLIHFFLVSLVWRTAIAYDSCNIDDYKSVLIDPTRSKYNKYTYTVQPGLCESGELEREDKLYWLNEVNQTDDEGDLYVLFPDERERQIINRFNQVPYCLAFIGRIKQPTVLMWSDEEEPLLTVGPVIELRISRRSVNFTSNFTDVTKPERLQICTNGTHATYYDACKEVETKPFMMTPSSGIKSLSVLAKRNQASLTGNSKFTVGVQQLYSVQCGDPLVDLTALASIQCRSVPTCDEHRRCSVQCPLIDQRPNTSLSQCHSRSAPNCTCEEKQFVLISNLTEVLKRVVDALPEPPVEVLSFCDFVAWRNSPNISVEEISGYDVRLINQDTSKEEIRHIDGYETFIVLDKENDVHFKQSNTTAEVRPTMFSSPVGSFSKPVNLGCKLPDILDVHFELNGRKYANNSVVSITEVGEGENALLCKTNKRDCCGVIGNRYGEFYYPNGVKVPIKKYSYVFYRNRGNQVVRLNRRGDKEIKGKTGVYCCVVMDTYEVEQKICIELKD